MGPKQSGHRLTKLWYIHTMRYYAKTAGRGEGEKRESLCTNIERFPDYIVRSKKFKLQKIL